MAEAKTDVIDACKKTRKLLKKFQKRGVVYWDGDDAPKSYQVLSEMISHAHLAGCRVLRLTSATVEYVTTCDRGSGRFAMIGG